MRTLVYRFLILAAPALLASGLMSPPPASATDYPVGGTTIGIFPRSLPSMDSAQVGPALPDGAVVSVLCETLGQVVDNGYAPSGVWAQLSDGTYLPNAFIITGTDGWTPGIPSCDVDDTTASSPGEAPKPYSGIWIENNDVSTQLINHYYSASGEAVVVDWAYFTQSARLRAELTALAQPDGYGTYEANPSDDGDIFYSVGAFTIARTSTHCYAIKDTYDFAPDKPANLPYIFNWLDAQNGSAAPFVVQASGCIFD